MTPSAVLHIIDQARRQEARSGIFLRQIRERTHQLPASIVIDNPERATHLFQFAVEYIEMAPRLIEWVSTCASEAGTRRLFTPFIEAAIHYFTQPSLLLAHRDGLDGLLIKAYLCHRLMEEMSENNRSIRRSHLVDVQMTQANLLVHYLLGEPFANELDESITVTLLQIAGSASYYELNLDPFVEQTGKGAWQWMRDYWETLLIRNEIRFVFNPNANRTE